MKGIKVSRWYRISFSLLGWIAIAAIPITANALNIESDRQLRYADELFNNKQYLRAAEEYQRFTFFFPNHAENRAAKLKAGDSFLLAKDPQTAIEIFKEISSADPPDDLAIEAFFRMSNVYLELKSPTNAVVQLNNVIALTDDPLIKDRAHYRIGWIHVDYADWPTAVKSFSRISPDGQQKYGIDELNQALSTSDSIPTKSPALAGVLSIVPGAGQLYCNRYEDALIAFVVNIGLGWAAYDAFDNEQYGLGGLLAFVGVGFYAGNIYGAVNDAHKYNRGQTRQFVDELMQNQMRLGSLPPGTTARRGLVFNLTIPF